MKGSTIEKSPGTWLIRAYVGRLNGKVTHVNRTVHGSKREAQRALATLISEVDAGKVGASEPLTVADLLHRWLDDVAPHRTPATMREYRRLVEVNVSPAIGAKRVNRLSGRDLDDFYRSLSDRGLTPSSIRRHHALVHAAYERAVRWGIVAANPADRASPPALRHAAVEAPAVNDVVRIMTAARTRGDSVLATATGLAATTGARRGELCALKWSDVDLEHGELRVARSLTVIKRQPIEGPTKTHQARTVALDPTVVALLAQRRLDQEAWATTIGTKLAADPYVLSRSADGSLPCLPNGITQAYGDLCRSLGIKTHFHSLRHFTATQAIAAGVDVRTVAGRLGHADPSVTLRTYSDVLQECDRAAAELLGNIVLGQDHTR